MIKRLLSLALALTASVTVLTAQTSNNKKESLIFCDEGGCRITDSFRTTTATRAR